jgi:hypothetical protein
MATEWYAYNCDKARLRHRGHVASSFDKKARCVMFSLLTVLCILRKGEIHEKKYYYSCEDITFEDRLMALAIPCRHDARSIVHVS